MTRLYKRIIFYKSLLVKKGLLFWIFGFFAFVWVVLRSGTNPKRLTYPCQQAAFPIASSWFVSVLIIFAGVFILKKLRRISIVLITITTSGLIFLSSSRFSDNMDTGDYPIWKSEDAVSNIFIFENLPPTTGSLAPGNSTVPDTHLSDPGIDSLIAIMNAAGTPFFKTAQYPGGIVGRNDVVILKCNFQWRHRLGTNTDRIKGVIWQILNHPENFEGEILVCDNQESQIWPVSWLAGFNDYSNNSDDLNQSIVDVVNTFKSKGYPVDYYVWDSLNYHTVTEYNQGNLADGYIFDAAQLTSYPKFLSPGGNYISLKNGIWNVNEQSYNKDLLTIINFPVLKAHGMVGATIALKNYIGVMNTTKHNEWFGGWVDDTFHPLYCFSEYALVARQIDLCWPKLNIIDATWVGTTSNYDYNREVIHTKTVLASTDPVAASWYAAKYILQPIASKPDRVDPEYYGKGGGKDYYYGTILHHWYNYLVDNTSRVVTKDPAKISIYGISDIVYTPVHDLTPTLTVTPNIMHGIAYFDLIVKITEINQVNTNGTIIIAIPKDSRWELTQGFNPSLTTLGNISLNNSAWSYSSDADNHIFTSGGSISAGGSSTFGMNITFDPLTDKGKYFISSNIIAGGNGEGRVNNNSDSEIIDYFQ